MKEIDFFYTKKIKNIFRLTIGWFENFKKRLGIILLTAKEPCYLKALNRSLILKYFTLNDLSSHMQPNTYQNMLGLKQSQTLEYVILHKLFLVDFIINLSK